MLIQWFLVTTTITLVLSSKILFLATVPSHSHGMWNTFLATELAKRGHEITYITPSTIKEVHPNITLKYFKQPEELLLRKQIVGVRLIERKGERVKALGDNIVYECEIMFEHEPYKSLLNSSENFDLIIFEYVGHDCLFGLSKTFESAPIILVGALPYMPLWINRNLGVPLFHMTPTLIQSTKNPSDFWERLESLTNYIKQDVMYYMHMRPEMDSIMKRYFGDDVLPIKDMWKKVSIYLINSADWMSKIPITPNIIPIGGMHLKESRPLSKRLLEFMNGAEHGVILISFGTNFASGPTSKAIFRIITSVAGKLPHRVLLKWNILRDQNKTLPNNVLALPWIPQNDVLGHPNMRLFVSHCGGQSSLETMYHGVPVLAVPIVLDQSENANRIVSEMAGLRLDLEVLTEESFLETINEIIAKPRYKDGALKLKSIMRDQPIKPLDRAIFWIEFVIRHKGASHLRPILWDLPHPYSLLVDIALVIIVATLTILLTSIVLLYLTCSAAKRIFDRVSTKNKIE